ncbi:MAG TPA: Holliday junction resolvase-like protein [Puia sp.]|nr:Holliday junction resolvase-like protein [Puia sp.]
MHKEIISFYSTLRELFVFCPACETPHRLSDCKLFQKSKPEADWKEKLDKDLERLGRIEELLEEKIEVAREAARLVGRKAADKAIRQIDPIFAPLKLNCDDSKVIFHPLDFIVFHGMKNREKPCEVTEIVLLDKAAKTGEALEVQKSLEKAVRQKKVEWMTLRVEQDGGIKIE